MTALLILQQGIVALVVATLLAGAWPRLPRVVMALSVVVMMVAAQALGWWANYWWYLAWPGFSVSTVILLLWWWQQRWTGRALVSPGQWRFTLWLLLGLGLLLFLGERLGMDLYGAGYGSFKLSTALLLLGLAVWVCRLYWTCLLLVLVQAAFAARLLGSNNLWDYLLDPWLLVGILLWIGWALIRGRAAPPER